MSSFEVKKDKGLAREFSKVLEGDPTALVKELGSDKLTPLHIACALGKPELVYACDKALVNSLDIGGNSPLHTLVVYQDPLDNEINPILKEIVNCLYESGCDFSRLNKDGKSAAALATSHSLRDLLLSLQYIQAMDISADNYTPTYESSTKASTGSSDSTNKSIPGKLNNTTRVK